MESHCRQSQKALSAHRRKAAATTAKLIATGRVPRRVTAAVLAYFCMVLDVMLVEMHAKRTSPIEHSAWNGGARRIESIGSAETTSQKRRRRCLRGAHCNIAGEISVWSPKWFAKNVRQVCDRVVGRPCRYRETVRSRRRFELQQFAVNPRSAPETILSGHLRRIESRQDG